MNHCKTAYVLNDVHVLIRQLQRETGVYIATGCYACTGSVLGESAVYTNKIKVQLMCECQLQSHDSCDASRCNLDSNSWKCGEDVVMLLSWQRLHCQHIVVDKTKHADTGSANQPYTQQQVIL